MFVAYFRTLNSQVVESNYPKNSNNQITRNLNSQVVKYSKSSNYLKFVCQTCFQLK